MSAGICRATKRKREWRAVSRKPQVAGVDSIAPFRFEIGQKACDHIGCEVLDSHLRGLGGLALCHKAKEQSQSISIASLGIDTEVAINPDLFQ
jgi:hypothetical protein